MRLLSGAASDDLAPPEGAGKRWPGRIPAGRAVRVLPDPPSRARGVYVGAATSDRGSHVGGVARGPARKGGWLTPRPTDAAPSAVTRCGSIRRNGHEGWRLRAPGVSDVLDRRRSRPAGSLYRRAAW